MNKRERVYAAMEGQQVDQVPLSLWRHFHKQDQTPAGLASATLAFYRKYDFDLIKLTPSDFYAVEDWGAAIASSKDDDTPPQVKKTVIKKPEDWRHLTTLNPREGRYGQTLEAVKLVTDQLTDEDAPVLTTLFSPLTLAYRLAGDKLFEHLESHSTDVHIGLATIAETTSRFAAAVIEAGADGLFLISELSRPDLLTEEMCQAFVICYDLIALERVKTQPVPLVLHLYGQNLYFETVNQYPVHAVSWQNHHTPPSLMEALNLTDKTLMAGLDDVLEREPETIQPYIRDTIQKTGGQRLILAPTRFAPGALLPKNLQAITEVDRSIY